jgi:transcriptional regulator with XRE-family HTH domain
MPSGEEAPAANPLLDAGTWIATLRVRRGLTRRELAQRAQVSYALLTKVEAAVELASPQMTAACAGALGVAPGLLAGPYLPASEDDLRRAAAERIRAGQDVLDLPPDERAYPRPLDELAAEVRQIEEWTRAARYTSVAAVMPRLVTDLRLDVLTLTGEDKRTALRLLTEANRVGIQISAAVLSAAAAGTAATTGGSPVPTAAPRPGQSIARGNLPRPESGALMPSRLALLGCGALGSLLGFGLARLYFSGNLFLLILGGCLGVLVAWLARRLMAAYGPQDPVSLKTMHGYVGLQGAIVMWAVSTAHGVWIAVTVAWVFSWCMKAAGGRRPSGLAAMYGFLAVVTAIMVYRLLYLHLSWWFVPVWAASSVVMAYVFPRLPRATRRFPAPGTGTVVSVLFALHLPWWVAALGGSLCGAVYLLPALSVTPGFPGDFGDVFPPVAPH